MAEMLMVWQPWQHFPSISAENFPWKIGEKSATKKTKSSHGPWIVLLRFWGQRMPRSTTRHQCRLSLTAFCQPTQRERESQQAKTTFRRQFLKAHGAKHLNHPVDIRLSDEYPPEEGQ